MHRLGLEFYVFIDCIVLICWTHSVRAQGNTEGSVRLRRGIDSQSGYVEIFHDGLWGRVCATEWDHNDAHVVCKQQGYNGARFPATDFQQPPNNGLPIVLDTLRCTGRETALANCPKGEWGQVADGCQTARVECVSYVPQYIGCFSDDLDRILPDYAQLCGLGTQDDRCGGCDFTNTACDSSVMTVDLCIEICCNNNDFIYAGLQAGDECYCGDATAQYAKIGRLPEEICNTQCSGNPQQSCGADYKIDVYDCSSGCEAPIVDKPNLITVPIVVQTRLYKTGETITFVCQNNFQLRGAQTISCQPGGPWSAPLPECVEPTSTSEPPVSVPCPYPTDTPQNGQYTPVEVTYLSGSSIQFTCRFGYQTAGMPTLSCQNDGTWTTGQHSCTAVDCGRLPDFPNAIPSTSTTTFETLVTFTCGAGYQLTGGASGKECDGSGNWIGADPQCAGGTTCGSPPFPFRGQFTPFRQSYQPEDTVTFSCFSGYRVVGSTTASCRTDGTWSDNVPTCELVDCGPLPAYAFVTPITEATLFATSVTFRCDDTYEFANGATPFKTCNADGQWVGIDPVCELSVCPALPKFYKAVQSTDSTVINTIVTFSCEAGYELQDTNPVPTKTCIGDGIWEGPNPVCQRSGCAPLLTFPNAIKSTEATDIGTVVTFTCREGYINQPVSSLPSKTCSPDKQWVGTDPNCIVDRDCGVLPVYPNAIPSTLSTNLNTQVSFQCEAGYQLVGSSAIKTCTQFGWQGTNPSCQALTCGPVPTFPNAEVQNPTGSQTVSTSVTYICEEGYVHQGGSGNLPFKTCTESLQWEGTDADCQAILNLVANCGPPDEADPGVVMNGTDFSFNSSVTFSCNNSDEEIEGNATIYCLGNGNWSSAVPSCVLIGNETDDLPTDGGVSSDSASGIPFFILIIFLVLCICFILLIAAYIVYRVHTSSYKKYKKDNAAEVSTHNDPHGVPMHGIAISEPKRIGHTNYGMSVDEEGDTGVASIESDMQDVSLGSESNYRYHGNPYAESIRSESVYPSGTNDSGMIPSDPESNSFGMDDAGAASEGADAETGTFGEQTGDDAAKNKDTDKKDKDFIDDMMDSAKEKLDNCVIQ